MKVLIGLAVLFVCAIYKIIFEVYPSFYIYLCLLAAIMVVEVIVYSIFSWRTRFSAAQKKQIYAAQEKDKEATQVQRQMLEKTVQQSRYKIKLLQVDLSNQQAKVRNMSVLAEKDKKYSTVKWLIEQIESRRADSLKEALNLYDAKCRRDGQIAMDRLKDQLARDQQIKEAYANFDRDMKEWEHRKTMEDLEKKKLEELRRIREECS